MTVSSNVFQLSQSGQRPAHLETSFPQLVHLNIVLAFITMHLLLAYSRFAVQIKMKTYHQIASTLYFIIGIISTHLYP